MTKDVLEDAQFTSVLERVLFISANKAFFDLILRIMPEDKYKAKVVFLFNSSTFLFMYDIKSTILDQFSNTRLFYINNF